MKSYREYVLSVKKYLMGNKDVIAKITKLTSSMALGWELNQYKNLWGKLTDKNTRWPAQNLLIHGQQ